MYVDTSNSYFSAQNDGISLYSQARLDATSCRSQCQLMCEKIQDIGFGYSDYICSSSEAATGQLKYKLKTFLKKYAYLNNVIFQGSITERL